MARIGEGRFADGRLFYRYWLPDDRARGQVVLAHGFAEHSGRYSAVAEALIESDLSVWALDHRGHGQSQGDRGDIESVWAAADDLGRFCDLVGAEAAPGPLFLVGHSLGGLIATAYAEEHQDRLAGLALSGALLHIPPEVVALGDLDEIPDLGLADIVSSDPAVVQAYKDDPLVYQGPPPRNFFRAAAELEQVRTDLHRLTLPVLVMHGSADLLVSPQALRDLVDRVSSVDLTARLWPGLWHEIFNEPTGPTVVRVLENWITERLP
jgi:alpha-beta hydrolase superfamily lysophospholipase